MNYNTHYGLCKILFKPQTSRQQDAVLCYIFNTEGEIKSTIKNQSDLIIANILKALVPDYSMGNFTVQAIPIFG